MLVKTMETLYIEEQKAEINSLMASLESQPVSKGSTEVRYGLGKLKRGNHRLVNESFRKRFTKDLVAIKNNYFFHRSSSALAKLDSEPADSEMHLSKMDVVLSFQLEVCDH